jgi:type II secretion system protein H
MQGTSQHLPRVRAGRGGAFTLIEVLLVVLIIGLMAALAVPSFVASLKGQRLDSAAHRIATACQQARFEAVFNGRTCWYVVDIDKQEVRLLQRPAGEEAEIISYEVIAAETNIIHETSGALETVSMPLGVTILRVQSQDGEVQDAGAVGFPFYSNGVCEPFRVFLESESGHVYRQGHRVHPAVT